MMAKYDPEFLHRLQAQQRLLARLMELLHNFGVQDMIMLSSDHGDPPSLRVMLDSEGMRQEAVDVLRKCVETLHIEFYGSA